MKGIKTPDEKIAEIRALRAKGHSITEICALTRLGRATVHGHARDVKLPFGPLKKGPKRKIALNVCRQLRGQGLTYRAIAKKIGCAVSRVHHLLNQGAAA